MADYQFDKSLQKVAYIVDHVPQARHDYLFLILTYWQIFDGIDIPESVVREILAKATQPTTIDRSKRKLMEQLRLRRLLEIKRMAKAEVKDEAP